MLNEKERHIYLTIKDIVDKKISNKEAAQILSMTDRNIRRLVKKYLVEGEEGFKHKGRGKVSKNKIDHSISESIVNDYTLEYYDYNFTHFGEEIHEKYNLSYPTIYRILSNGELISPLAQKETRRKYINDMKKSIEDNTVKEEIKNVYNARLLQEEQAHFRKSTNLYRFGEELQLDAAFLIWFGDVATALHLAVDKATKKVLFGWFDYQETTRTYYIILFNIIMIYGIPKKIKTDKRGSFSANNNFKSTFNTTQFGRVCNVLDIELDSNSNPLFKPNVERENYTFESRLKAELRHNNITNIDEANEYLINVFIPKINAKFSYEIDPKRTLMRKNPYSEFELNLLISEKTERLIDNASSIRYDGKYYTPINEDSKVVSFINKTKCTVIIAYDYTLWCQIEGKYYKLKEIESYKSTIETTNKEVTIKERKVYIPPKDHPWRHFKI